MTQVPVCAMTSLAVWAMPSHTSTEILAISLRWVHLVAGITWIGLLYFFNLMYMPFMKKGGVSDQAHLLERLTLPVLNWFRWSSLLTVFVGFWYWSQVYVAAAAHAAGKSPWLTIGLFVLVWSGAFHIFKAVLIKPPSAWLLGVIVVVLIGAAAWTFVRFTPVGGDDNHVLSIGIGGGIGWFMVSSVWGIVWRNNSKIIKGTLAGAPPANAALLSRQVFLTARTGFYLSFPMIFFMAASSHFPILGK